MSHHLSKFQRMRRSEKQSEKDRIRRAQLMLLPCHYCKGKATTTDHMTPTSKGGSSRKENLVPSCESCNRLKADMSYDDFMLIIRHGLLKTLRAHGRKALKTIIDLDELRKRDELQAEASKKS